MEVIINSSEELEKIINEYVQATLLTNVADKIKDYELEHIQTDVYDVYSPEVYQRRGKQGGLADRKNLEAVVHHLGNSSYELTVENRTLVHPYHYLDRNWGNSSSESLSKNVGTYVVKLVTKGGFSSYDYPHPRREYYQPRPFIKNTINDLKTSNAVDEAFKDGMKSWGFDIS